jgi:hypothetical protein
MSDPLTASDFWPLILKLPHDERVRLAKLALRAAAHDDSAAAAYAAVPPARTSSRRMTNRSLGKAKVGRSSVRRGEIRWLERGVAYAPRTSGGEA